MTITLTREESQQVLDALTNSLALGAVRYEKAIETLRARLSAPEPVSIAYKLEPVAWMYEDDEGRMMFSQMPQNPPLWEPVYRATLEKNT